MWHMNKQTREICIQFRVLRKLMLHITYYIYGGLGNHRILISRGEVQQVFSLPFKVICIQSLEYYKFICTHGNGLIVTNFITEVRSQLVLLVANKLQAGIRPQCLLLLYKNIYSNYHSILNAPCRSEPAVSYI